MTGDTTISATVRNSAGDAVRSLGSFGVDMGDGSIPWDGRDSSGAGVANGPYALDLTSNDPHGTSTSAQETILRLAERAERIHDLAEHHRPEAIRRLQSR